MRNKIITVVGGTGFVGRYVVKLLANQGYTIRVISRNPEAALHLKTAGEVGQIVLTAGNLACPDSLTGKLDNSWAVINLAGILFESGSQSFSAVHARGAEKLAQLARAAGVARFVHMSSLGADKPVMSKYVHTKAMGEKAVKAAFPEATVLRPSVIFGPEDQFFNTFASLARFAPALPLIGGGHTRFQPVYVGDVAQAVATVLTHKESAGEIYEIGGPLIYTFKELLRFICDVTHRRPLLLSVPFGLMSCMSRITELLPNPPITHDQVSMLEYDNVVGKDMKTLADLGITPDAVEAIVPYYLQRFARQVPVAA